MLAGASGSGKTTIALQSVRRMQDDKTNWLGLHGAGVAWITADREGRQTEEKAKSIGLEIIEWYSLVGDRSISDSKLRAYLTKNPMGLLTHIMDTFKKPYDILLVDPLIPFMGGDMNSYQDTLISLISLSRIAEDNRIAILGITHTPKGQQGPNRYMRPQDHILGSNAYQGYCDTLHVVLDTPGSPLKQLYTRSHTAPESYLKLCQVGPWLSDDPLDFPAGETDEIEELPPVSYKEVADWITENVSDSRATVYRKLKAWMEED